MRSAKRGWGFAIVFAVVLAAATDAVADQLSFFQKVSNTNMVAAGVGGMRDIGTGVISLSGISGSVTKAYLYWQGPTNSADASANASISLNGNPIVGTNRGFSSDNCWGFANSQAYRADVTTYVTGNGTYSLTGLLKESANINGASLIVFFNGGNASNNRDVMLFDGNDSNMNNPFDSDGWNASLPGIQFVGGAAFMHFHVSDGQTYADAAVFLNDTSLVAAGSIFDGNSGTLWDIKTFDVTGFLQPGTNTLTSGVNVDCLSLVVVAVDVAAAGLALVPIGDKTVDEGVELAFQVNATGGGETLTFTAFELPRGATFEPTSGWFIWTPASNQAGKYFPCFQVSDGESADVECPTFTVNDTIVDRDGDGVPDAGVAVVDNCPDVPNPDQSNLYGGLAGDVCDTQFVNTPVTTTSLNTSDVSVGQPIVMHACVTFTPTSPPSFVVRPDPFFVLLEVLDSAGHEVLPDGLAERRGLALPSDLVLITTTQTLCTDIPVSELFFLPAGSFALNAKYVTVGVKDPYIIVNGTCTDPVGCYEPILQTIAPAGSQTITVRDTAGAQTGLDTLIAALSGLSDQGLGNSLRAKLQAARLSLLKGNINAACGQLTAFINEVSAQAGKKLTAAQAATFTSMANAVKTLLVCA